MEETRSADDARGRRPAPGRGSGFTLVALVVVFTVMTVLVAAVLPSWTHAINREKEEELIFRGLQYAEAIRVFQLRFGRYPVRLEELLNVKPRCIRQLWKDPVSESGEWGLVFGRAARGQGRNRPGNQIGIAPDQRRGGSGSGLRTPDEAPELGGGTGPSGRRSERRPSRTVGPIIGVHSLSEEDAIKVFFDSQTHNEWRFVVQMIPTPVVVPGGLQVSRANVQFVGRSFPEGLEPKQGKTPTSLQPSRNQPSRRPKSGN
jgi:type II secretory pathway pseudopilin PulG